MSPGKPIPLDQRVEYKYQLDEQLASEVKEWARSHLGVDAHCDTALGDSYEVNTLYLDTLGLDLYFRTRVAGRSKHRLRRYGREATVWLETKRKNKDCLVRKTRTAVAGEELSSHLQNFLSTGHSVDRKTAMGTAQLDSLFEHTVGPAEGGESKWSGQWFMDRIALRGLLPTVLVHYRRLARTAMLNNENLRLTIDSHIQCSLPSQWNVSQRAEVIVRDVPNVYILELKFCNQMPSLFKDLLRTFPLARTSFSKYRSAIDAWEVQHLAAANPARIETINHATHPCGNT